VKRVRLVFIDETATTTKMTRLRGRAPHGQRLQGRAPFGHWKTQTFIAGLRCDARTAPWIIDRPMTKEIFEIHVETQLAPTLDPGDPGSSPGQVRDPRQPAEPQERKSQGDPQAARRLIPLPAAIQP